MRAIRLVQPRLSAIVASLVVFLSLTPRAAQAEDAPDARDILKSVRVAQSAQNRTMEGQLRTGSKKIPFRLSMNDGQVRWEFSNPAQTLILRLGDESSSLEEVTPNGKEKIGGRKLDDPVRDSDITYEDLAMHFIYWKDAKVEGEQTIMLNKSWQLLVQPPSAGASSYSKVRLWIGKDTGALLKAEAYGRDGKIARIFRVVSGQKTDDGLWILKSMRIESTKSRTGGDQTPTYLDITSVAK